MAECLQGLAGVAVAMSKPEQTAPLFGAAEMIREAAESPLWSAESMKETLPKLPRLPKP